MGMSIQSTPLAAMVFAMAIVASGGEVLMSATIWPLRSPSSMPAFPVTTSRRIFQFARERMTSSASLTASRGDAAAFIPCGTRSAICFLTTSYPVTAYPALRSKAEMGVPIIPRPMTAILLIPMFHPPSACVCPVSSPHHLRASRLLRAGDRNRCRQERLISSKPKIDEGRVWKNRPLVNMKDRPV